MWVTSATELSVSAGKASESGISGAWDHGMEVVDPRDLLVLPHASTCRTPSSADHDMARIKSDMYSMDLQDCLTNDD